MYEMRNWSLDFWEDNHVVLWGEVYNHEYFAQGCQIHTNRIKEVETNQPEGYLIMITHSDSHYYLSFREISIESLEKTRACASLLNISPAVIDECVVLSKSR